MAAIINSNINSLTAQRNLTKSQSSLATSMQRLSSGLRINSAKDDAAGLSIADRFTSQIRGMTQAARNANDGISLAQTAEGALGSAAMCCSVSANWRCNRQRTNSASDRSAMNAEVSSWPPSWTVLPRTRRSTARNLLDGSFTSASFQVGAMPTRPSPRPRPTSLPAKYGNNRMGSVAATATSTVGDLVIGSTAGTTIPLLSWLPRLLWVPQAVLSSVKP